MLRPPGLPHLPMNAHLATAHAPGHAGTGAWACEAAAAWSAGAPEVADPEQASCELASVYSPNQLRVLGSPSAFRMRWRRGAMGPMLLSALSFDVEVELQQQASQSFYLVSTQLRGRAQIDAGRVQGGGGAGLVVIDSATCPVHKRFSADSQRLHVRLSREEVAAACTQLLERPLTRPPEFQPMMAEGSAAQQRWLALTALLFDRAAAPPPPALAPRLYRQFAELAILTLLTEHRHSYSDALAAPVGAPAPRHVRRAQEYMRAHAAEPLTLAEVAQTAGVSLRTLSAGFQACHGTSPMRWLREVRLQGAHADLSRANGSVADIALRWGFAHFGRFAAEYARRFGQSPSRTLRR